MTDTKSINKQLKEIGCDYAVWGRTEIHELSNVLMEDEQILQAVNGYYDGGFALLCVTNYRVLVIDKKPFLLTVEDLRYDMIAEVDYSSRIITAVLHVYTPLRTLMFTSWSMPRLRKSMNYIQQRVMELRNNEFLASQFEAQQATNAMEGLQNIQEHQQRVPQMVVTRHGVNNPPAQFDRYKRPQKTLINPYTKVPLLARRRRYPSFY